MHRFFCFLSCFVGLAVSSSAYGVWPNPKKFIEHLVGTSGLYATFKAAFEDVYREAEPSGFENLKLFGEKNGALEPWKKFAQKKYNYDVVKTWENRGFFSCMVGLINVLNIEDVEKAVEGKFSKDSIDNKLMPAVTKICKVLLSEDFAKKLLTDSFVAEFLKSVKTSDYSYCSVNFYSVWYSKDNLKFSLEYVQPSSQVRLEFQVNFNVKKCCLEKNGEVDIGWFEIQGCFIHSDKGCLSQQNLVEAKDKLDKGKTFIGVKGVSMKVIRMIENANMGDKKLMENNPQTEQAHNTQPFSAASNPPLTNKVPEEDSFHSEFPNTELSQGI